MSLLCCSTSSCLFDLTDSFIVCVASFVTLLYCLGYDSYLNLNYSTEPKNDTGINGHAMVSWYHGQRLKMRGR